MTSFTTNRSLLNPKFEGYKLAPLSQDETVARYPLQWRPSQATESGRSRIPLSFEEVQSRITHNHLAINPKDAVALYVDGELNVVRIVVDSESLRPTLDLVYELPKPISSPNATPDIHRDYPSIRHVFQDVWLVSDGYGQLYVLELKETGRQLLGTFCLPSDQAAHSVPFKLHSCRRIVSGGTVNCILSSRHQQGREDSVSVTYSKQPVFDIWLISIPLRSGSEESQAMTVIWKGQGDDIPVYSTYDSARDAYIVLGSSVYKTQGVERSPLYEPTKDELAPIPRAGEHLPEKPPPYSWTQTPDSVTVAFPLPSDIPKSAIKVMFTVQTVTLFVNGESSSVDLPQFDRKKLWDGISPSDSVWTWDKEAEHKFGLLSLHLEKQHEGTRWSHVFASAGTKTSATEPDEIDVPETLDPSELWMIRESLEKYTSALVTGEDASGLGLGTGVPSLADGEMDDTVDDSVGRKVYMTWIAGDGTIPDWVEPSEGLPTYLLALPLPGSADTTSLVIKSDIDGLLFTLPPRSSLNLPGAWTHTSTYPALAFVLASKRDTRFTFHLSSQSVLAFESGSSLGGGNVYIYRSPTGRELWAKQAIVKVAGGTAGSLLGVGLVQRPSGGVAIVCLCEGELVILRDVI